MTHIDILLRQLARGTVKAHKSIVLAGHKDKKYDGSHLYETAKNAICFDFGNVDEMPDGKTNKYAWKLPYPVIYGEFDMESNQGPITKIGFLASHGNHENLTGSHIFKLTSFRLDKNLPFPIFIDFHGYADENGKVIGMGEINSGLALCGALSTALTVMSCKNVEVIESIPSELRIARAKKNKLPFFSTWTLHIKNTQTHIVSSKKGSHASPRVHLRRGHIREYKPGKFTWIPNCVVGNKKNGCVMKDYKLST